MIPIIDWQDFSSGKSPEDITACIGGAARTSGAFVLTNHGIPRGVLRDVLELTQVFFDLGEDSKGPAVIDSGFLTRGWCAGSKTAGGDSGESFTIGRALGGSDTAPASPGAGDTGWPEIDGFHEAVLDMYKEMSALSRVVMRAFEPDLALPNSFFASHFTRPMSILSLLRYPVGQRGGEQGAKVHRQNGALSLIVSEGDTGVEVQTLSGDWVPAPHVPSGILVKAGDCLARWSNDAYVSSPMRVPQQNMRHHAVVFALAPNTDSIVAPLPRTGSPKYAPITAADYLLQTAGEFAAGASAAE
ncbi:2-oxoglutarate and iron-dependent oxygenase domain-containing protein [Celeribacter arenosi]